MKSLTQNKMNDRTFNAQKYTGIKLIEHSDEYFKLESADENSFIIFKDFKASKNGEFIIFNPENNKRDKPYFFKSFACIITEMDPCPYLTSVCIVKPIQQQYIDDLNDLANNGVVVWPITNLLKIHDIKIKKF